MVDVIGCDPICAAGRAVDNIVGWKRIEEGLVEPSTEQGAQRLAEIAAATRGINSLVAARVQCKNMETPCFVAHWLSIENVSPFGSLILQASEVGVSIRQNNQQEA